MVENAPLLEEDTWLSLVAVDAVVGELLAEADICREDDNIVLVVDWLLLAVSKLDVAELLSEPRVSAEDVLNPDTDVDKRPALI